MAVSCGTDIPRQRKKPPQIPYEAQKNALQGEKYAIVRPVERTLFNRSGITLVGKKGPCLPRPDTDPVEGRKKRATRKEGTTLQINIENAE